jgi:hypothetical protein
VALIALASAKGSPGVTTTALALTLHWPRPALLVDADLAGSGVMPGYFKGQLQHDHGLQQLAIANSHGHLEARLWEESLPLTETTPTKRVLPGLTNAVLAPALTTLWSALVNQLGALERGGYDAIVDLGRISARGDPREVLLSLADQVLMVTGSRLPDVVATRGITSIMVGSLEPTAQVLANMSVLTVGPGRPYGVEEIRDVVGVPSVGHIAWDPVAADVFSVGEGTSDRVYRKSALVRSLQPVIDHVQGRVRARRALFAPVEVRS